MDHTEGPWEVVALPARLNDWTGASFLVRNQRHAPGGIAVTIGGVGKEEEANAHLIAAAPRLLDTLRTIADFAVGEGDVCEIIAKRARLAIATAEGQDAEGQ